MNANKMFLCCALVAFAAISLNAAVPPVNDRVASVAKITEAKIWTSPKGGTLPYRLYSPENADGKMLPLVVLLHGAGERGTDNSKQLVHGAYELMDYAKTVPFYAIFPQCPSGDNKKWANLDWSKHGHSLNQETDLVRMVFEIIDETEKTLKIDPDRIYICGISMGGYGTWDMLCRKPSRFAAGLVCCGGGDAKTAARALTHKPIWVVHGDRDGAVPYTNSVEMVNAIKAAGGKKIKFTTLEGWGHCIWEWAFGNKEILDWMFAQKRIHPDFCQNNRYAEANAAVSPGKIVLFGDSITDNWPNRRKEFFEKYGFVGRGISGQTTVDMLGRFQQDVIALKPKAVAILAGTNDMAENRGYSTPALAKANIASMCDIAKAHGIKVYICSVTPVNKYGWRPAIDNAALRVKALNELLKTYAAENNIDYIDYYSQLVDKTGGMGKNANDGVHPNAIGYAVMEKILLKALGL
jgi:poly(3-hydroxybutyrate) depolymerase/lysophospholipase L1-like esterase